MHSRAPARTHLNGCALLRHPELTLPKPGVRGSTTFRDATLHTVYGVLARTGMNSPILDAHGGAELCKNCGKVKLTFVSVGGFSRLRLGLRDSDPRRMTVWLREERSDGPTELLISARCPRSTGSPQGSLTAVGRFAARPRTLCRSSDERALRSAAPAYFNGRAHGPILPPRFFLLAVDGAAPYRFDRG